MKYYIDNYLALMEYLIFGCKIQSANQANFSDAKICYQIDSLWIFYYLPLDNKDLSFRYW